MEADADKQKDTQKYTTKIEVKINSPKKLQNCNKKIQNCPKIWKITTILHFFLDKNSVKFGIDFTQATKVSTTTGRTVVVPFCISGQMSVWEVATKSKSAK